MRLAPLALVFACACTVNEPAPVERRVEALEVSQELTLDTPKVVSTAGEVSHLQLAYNGSKHYVLWLDARDAPYGPVVLGRDLNTLGGVGAAGMDLVVSQYDPTDKPVLTSGADQYRLVLLRKEQDYQPFLATLDTSHEANTFTFIDAGYAMVEPLALASNEQNLLLGWRDAVTGVMGYTMLTFDGGIAAPSQPLSGPNQNAVSIGVATHDGGYFVAWTRTDPTSTLVATAVSGAGVATNLTPTPVVDDLKGLFHASAAPIPPGWVAVCGEDEVQELARASRFDVNGVALDLPAATIFTDPAVRVDPVVVYQTSDVAQVFAITGQGVVSRGFNALNGSSGPVSVVRPSGGNLTELVASAHPGGSCAAWVLDGGQVHAACGPAAGPWTSAQVTYASNEQRRPAVAAVDGGWLVVFGDNRNGRYEARLAQLQLDGELVGFTQTAFSGSPGQQVQYAVSSFADELVIAVTEVGSDAGPQPVTRWVRRDANGYSPQGGALLDPEGVASTNVVLAKLANAIAAAWLRSPGDGGTEVISSLYPPGGPWGPRQVLGAAPNLSEPAIACGPAQCLVAWVKQAPNQIEGVRINDNGQPLDVVPADLATGNNGRVSPALAWGNGRYQLVWADQANGGQEIVARQVQTDGGLDAVVVVSQAYTPEANSSAQPTVSWDGKSFVTVFTVEPPEGSLNLYRARLSPTGSLLSVRSQFSARRENEHHASSASNGGGRTLVAYERLAVGGNEGSVRIRMRFHADIDLGLPCFTSGECVSGACVEGVCCNSSCTGAGPGGCRTCLASRGASADGTCSTAAVGVECRAAIDVCDLPETCDGTSTTCPADVTSDASCMASPCDGGSCDGGSGSGGGAGGNGGGAGGGGEPLEPRVLVVGCGCGAGSGSLAALALALLVWRRRGSRA